MRSLRFDQRRRGSYRLRRWQSLKNFCRSHCRTVFLRIGLKLWKAFGLEHSRIQEGLRKGKASCVSKLPYARSNLCNTVEKTSARTFPKRSQQIKESGAQETRARWSTAPSLASCHFLTTLHLTP